MKLSTDMGNMIWVQFFQSALKYSCRRDCPYCPHCPAEKLLGIVSYMCISEGDCEGGHHGQDGQINSGRWESCREAFPQPAFQQERQRIGEGEKLAVPTDICIPKLDSVMNFRIVILIDERIQRF